MAYSAWNLHPLVRIKRFVALLITNCLVLIPVTVSVYGSCPQEHVQSSQPGISIRSTETKVR